MGDLVRALPKCELHVHIEGTLEPDLMFSLAERNGMSLPFQTVDEARAAYRFTDLQSFLDIYYRGASVLQTAEDFYELMTAYLDRAAADGVRHAEIFFDPQTHTGRGIGFKLFMDGFRDAIADAGRRTGISADLIMCFLRHLSGEEALATLADAEAHLEGVVAVGLDSSETGNPPELFEEAYARARSLGLRAVAHAGEEGPPGYVWSALEVLGAERIDHGVRSLEDEVLVSRLVEERVPLTVCPLSNLALRVVDTLEDHPLPTMMERGLLVSVNSDDPAYFGGYVGDNYRRIHESLGVDEAGLVALARNSILSSFLAESRKNDLIDELARSERDQGELA
ncbi:MAG: adenosine deaminase [Actinobacteria bacterium]|nr:adenosine deaminase [Actinomycetota bacterium]